MQDRRAGFSRRMGSHMIQKKTLTKAVVVALFAVLFVTDLWEKFLVCCFWHFELLLRTV
jgi:hypothetical protein